MNSNRTSSRITVLSVCIMLFAVVVAGRLFFVQVIHSKAYDEKADRQFATPTTDVFDRGTIYFTRKDGHTVEAASIMEGYKVAINPTQIENKTEAYAALAKVITLDKADFMKYAGDTTDPYAEVATKLTQDEAMAIQKLKIPGVSVFKQKWRFYPGNSLASQTLGFVAYKGDDLAGRYGVERYYDDVLSRQKDNLYVNFFAEVFSNISNSLFSNDKSEGDIVTTIDPVIQQHVQDELNDVMKKWKSDSAGAIVMDPKDGSIYAMAYTPGFDLNAFSKVENVQQFSNPLVENVFEFGSVIKPLVMAGALDMNAVTPETTYYDKGYVEVSGKKLNNFDKKGRGTATMQDVLNQSLNTGMVFVEQKMGKENFRKYMLSYGIGEKTGIDLPNETSGLVSNLQSHGDVEYATAAFGQGIALSPVEAIRAFGALANGGVMVTPHIMKNISYALGSSKDFKVKTAPTALKPETSVRISRMLSIIVDKALGNGQFKLEHYTIAAKTGTAQIPLPSGKGYYTDRNLHSLFGYFPAFDPRFVMIFFTENPKGPGSEFAATTMAKPYMDTAKFLLNYYEVPPDR